jgi:hypothetical protein
MRYGNRIGQAVSIMTLGAVLGLGSGWLAPAFADDVHTFTDCKSDESKCGTIRVKNRGAYTISKSFLEGSEQSKDDALNCNKVDYEVDKDLKDGDNLRFIVPAKCHYKLVVDIAGAVGSKSSKDKKMVLTQGCELTWKASGTVDSSKLKLKDSTDKSNGCTDGW